MALTSESLKELRIFNKPMCLISTTDDGKLKLDEETLTEIKKIDMPLVVVAIAGLYRTGKSYLMNCLAGQTKGFALGNTTESKTKGIWAWCRIHPKKDDKILLLLDTEGLGDIAKGDSDHDNKVFTISALLCNVLVYNMMSVFNQDAVEKLTFISEMSKNLSFASSEMNKDEKIDLILPIFVLCLRDFILDIEKDGKELTTDEYLEDCLELKPGTGKDIDKFNRPRACLRKYFPKRKCFTFDRPGNKSVMKRLETANINELSEDFREETEMFLNYIYSCNPKVLLSSKSVRGMMFVTLATTYINAISIGAIPDVDDAIQMVSKMENERMALSAVEEFKNSLQTIKLPVLRIKDFIKLYEDIQNESLAHFRSEAMFESEVFEQRAIDEMNRLWKSINDENCKLIKQYCIAELKETYDEIVKEKKESGKYLVSGGYEEYKEDIVKVKRQYRQKMTEIEEYEVTQSLNAFIDAETDYESEVLSKDKKLSEEDRKKEIENLKKENEEAYVKQQKLFEEKIAEEKQRTEEHYKRLESDREAYMKREEEKMHLLMEQWKEQKTFNEKQIQMMKADNEKQRQEFRDEIKQLNEAYSRREKEHMEHRDRILAQERDANQKQNEAMKKAYEDFLQKQEEERKLNDKIMQLEATMHEQERRRNDDIKREQDLQFTKQLAELRANINQSKLDAANAKAENDRLKNRSWWERLINK